MPALIVLILALINRIFCHAINLAIIVLILMLTYSWIHWLLYIREQRKYWLNATNNVSYDYVCKIPYNIDLDLIRTKYLAIPDVLIQNYVCEHNNRQLKNVKNMLELVIEPENQVQYIEKNPAFYNWNCSFCYFIFLEDILIEKTNFIPMQQSVNKSENSRIYPNKNADSSKQQFCLVECQSGGHYYREAFAFLPDLSHLNNIKNESKSKKPSVLILAIESLTQWNYQINMPKTKKVLDELYQSIYLKGLTRIADNTFPNMMALMTGALNPDSHSNYIDDTYQFVWKLFEKNSYATGMIDDDHPIYRSIFHYNTSGFRQQPTTFYPRAIWYYYDWNMKSPCISSKGVPPAEVVMNYTKKYIRWAAEQRQPFFLLSMNIVTTHNRWEFVRLLDSHYEEFLIEMKSFLQNAIVILMGDHGFRQRIIPVKYSQFERIDSRLPLFAISTPNWMSKDYLIKNQERLSTLLDAHKMLVEIATGQTGSNDAMNYSSQNKTNFNGRHAYSPLSELIPINRTCDQAKIPPLYCICETKKYFTISLNNMNNLANLAMEFLGQLNQILPKNCAQLKLAKIIESFIYEPNSYFGLELTIPVELTIQVEPSGAVLRTMLNCHLINGHTNSTISTPPQLILATKITRNFEIERLNRYNNQSNCINDRILRKYCFCLLNNDSNAPNNANSNNATIHASNGTLISIV